MSLAAESVAVGPWTTEPRAGVAMFDFGAVSISFRIGLTGVGWADLQRLAVAVEDCRALELEARRRAEDLLGPLGPAVRRPRFADIVEDYVVFRAHEWAIGRPGAPAASITRDAAAPFDPDAGDILAVLEFANVELLEMRFLDDRLDGVLDRSYLATSVDRRRLFGWRRTAEERRRIATLQMENALLFEGINNAIKLVGDQYLSRVYRAATKRFHLAEWDASVLRKLDTLQNLYEKLADAQSTRRMEVLEWIIIVLIAVSIVLPFVTTAAK
jgi:hypothetical protein